MFKSDKEIETLKVQASIDLNKAESVNTAKEVASKYIGKTALPWIVLLVIVGVVASAYLSIEALPAVIGLVSTAVMAMIAMLTNITGTKEKEEKPEFKVINELIRRLDEANEEMSVHVAGENVTVKKGNSTVTTTPKDQPAPTDNKNT